MAFRSVIHMPDSPDKLNELKVAIARFRSEQTARRLTERGAAIDAVRACLHERGTHEDQRPDPEKVRKPETR